MVHGVIYLATKLVVRCNQISGSIINGNLARGCVVRIGRPPVTCNQVGGVIGG